MNNNEIGLLKPDIMKIFNEEEIDYDNMQFYVIIQHFCNSLVSFSMYVRKPTIHILDTINLNKYRSKRFDDHIVQLEKFNTISYDIIDYLKGIIISLNILFVNKKIEDVGNFIELLRVFLLFLLESNIFDNLTFICKYLDKKKEQDRKVIERMTHLKYLIFRVCNLTIDITSIFIPKINVVKEIFNILEKKTDDILQDKLDNTVNSMKIDDVIKQLLDIQLRSQIIKNFTTDTILNNLVNKKSNNLMRIIENLQTEYIELLSITLNVKMAITTYKQKKNYGLFALFGKSV
jgi:hypothetical protein